MKITVVGTGYVGLVTGTCFAEVGIEVVCIDIDQKKIDNLHQGILPSHSPHAPGQGQRRHDQTALRSRRDDGATEPPISKN